MRGGYEGMVWTTSVRGGLVLNSVGDGELLPTAALSAHVTSLWLLLRTTPVMGIMLL